MLSIVCETITPTLLIAVLALPWLYRGRLARAELVRLIAVQTGLGMVATYSLMALDKQLGWWPNWGLDYSTHSAFALSLALPLIKQHHWAWIGLLLFYGFCMQQLHYHSVLDMLTTGLAWALACLPFIYLIEQYLQKPQTVNS